MRPRELTIRGFRSYRDEVTIDFRGRRLIGIVGPIGAGKSTILDAVAFALYGKTPRVQRDTRSLINQLADAAHVQLTFEVDGQIWRATRAIRRKGAGHPKLEQLAEDTADAAVLETVVQDRPVRDRIERLLGMDFDAFGRSVLLAQNQFADFLLATDKPRNEVLKGVFGYERFDDALAVVREHVARAEATAAALDDEGVRLTDALAALEEARAAAVEATARRAVLDALRPQVEEIDRADAADAARSMAATEELARLERLAAQLPAAEDLEAVITADADAQAVVEKAAQLVADAEEVRLAAEAARAAAEERSGDLQAFEDLVAELHRAAEAVTATAAVRTAAARETETATTAVDAAQTALGAAAGARAAADASLAEAARSLQDADAALHEARHAEAAATLRATLVVGEPCPVCAQVVTKAPRAVGTKSVRSAERARDRAAGTHERAGAARDEAVRTEAQASAAAAAAADTVTRTAAASASAEAAATEAEATLATVQSTVVDRLGEGEPAELLDERRRELRTAEAEARAAAEHERAARDTLDTARREHGAAAAGVAAIRERLAAAWGVLDTEAPTEAAELRDAFDAVVGAAEQRRSAAASAVEEVTAARTGRAARRAELLIDAGLGAEADVAQAATEGQLRAAQAEERARLLDDIVAAGADLQSRIVAARDRLALTRRLKSDLQPAQFLVWLLDEERRTLAELASTHFEELTDGDYRFAEDGTFRIVDVNAAGAVREATSLSGGETFLASLALALALAEMVTRGGGRLDSFFLDEGFGSLDPEHIERAMAGIEHLLQGNDRLVVLVSHVTQMHELIEDLIELDKDGPSGGSRVLSGAAPP